jgi:uncharacterized protein YceH (UPF0502 family)
VHFQQLTDVEQRVLGCLLEKRWTTPDQYPLSINALRLACNQSTNRDPVTAYTEDQVFQAAQRLTKYGLARLASGHSSRATKYRHLAEEGLGLEREPLAVLCVLLLRGPQTPGELKQRSERLVASPLTLEGVERVLDELARRGYATNLGRRPGQKEDRHAQLLGGDAPEPVATTAVAAPEPVAVAPHEVHVAPPAAPAPAPAPATQDARIDELSDRVATLEASLADLRSQLADLLG